MGQNSARSAALNALRLWRKSQRLADSIISGVLDRTGLSAPDRAFAFDLFYGTLRNLTLLDFWIAQLRKGKLDVDLRDILQLGLYQLFVAKVPAHAAVHESVELTSQHRKGFINGILRNAIRNREQLEKDAEAQPLAVRSSHPEFLISRWEKNFGVEEARALCAWNNQPPRIFGRINHLQIGREEFMRQNAAEISALAGLPAFVEFPKGLPMQPLKDGHYYVQDPSTRIACELLDPQPGENILDACAAPGGKTAYIADLMKNGGAIVAVDQHADRLAVLNENIERLGLKKVQAVSHDWASDNASDQISTAAPFDRILIDAPCTNTGVMRRRVDVRWRVWPDEFSRMQKQQIAIVRSVIPLLKPNGVLVYSTCSLEPEENRGVVESVLGEMSILRLDAEKNSLPFRDGFDGAYAARLIKTA